MGKKIPAHIKNRKRKNVDYFTLSLFVIIMGTLTFLVANPDMINFNKDNITKVIIEETSYIYNGFNFNKEAGIWYTQIERNGLPYIIMTEHGPKEVENMLVSYKGNIFNTLTRSGNTIYLSFDPTQENKSDVAVAAVDFAKGLSIVYRMDVESACLVNATECTQIQTCNTTDKAIIEIIKDDNPRAEYEGNCLRVYGKNTDLIKVVNRLMFEWYGIIQVDETGQVYRI